MGGVGLLVIFLLGGRAFLQFLGGEDEVLRQAYAYAVVLLSGSVFLWLIGTVTAIYRGMGEMQFPAAIMIFNALVQIPLSGCLILGWGGLPALGIIGAAISAIVAAALLCLPLFVKLSKGDLPVRLRLSAMRFSKSDFDEILRVALPASLSPLLTIATVLVLTAYVASFGEAALAGYGIGSRVEFLIIPLVFGLGAAMTTAVGASVGAGELDRAERLGAIGGLSAGVIAGLVGIVLALFPNAWIGVFTDVPAVHAAARSYIEIVGPLFFFHGLGLSLYFASQGASAMFWPVWATVLRVLVAALGGYVLAFTLDFGLSGIYTAAAAAMLTYAVVIAAAIKAGAWRHANN